MTAGFIRHRSKSYYNNMIPYYIIPGLKNRKVKAYRVNRTDDVIKMICEHFKITPIILKQRNRSHLITEPRFICWHVLFNLIGLTKTQIGEMFDMNHTTIFYGLKRCEGLIKTEPEFRSKVDRVYQLLKPDFPEFIH